MVGVCGGGPKRNLQLAGKGSDVGILRIILMKSALRKISAANVICDSADEWLWAVIHSAFYLLHST